MVKSKTCLHNPVHISEIKQGTSRWKFNYRPWWICGLLERHFCNAGFQGTILGYSTSLILIQISISDTLRNLF